MPAKAYHTGCLLGHTQSDTGNRQNADPYYLIFEFNNDATLDDAPATVLSQCSDQMRGFYQAADLIISRGRVTMNL